jgi:glutamate synthase (NADPH) small chain
MSNTITKEAKRCLQCNNPLCSTGCPVNTQIKEMIAMLLDKRIYDAGEMLFENNPLSLICSLICPHERLCEGGCILAKKGQAIEIGQIEHYISDFYINLLKPHYKKQPDKKVAIIGSGPAGITIAVILASRGYDITIFEAHDRIGGVLVYGIPEFRLPKAILKKLEHALIEMGIKIRLNTLIGPVLTIDDLFRDGYQAVFIGTGVWRPRNLGIKGESLGHVHFAIDYLKNPDVYSLGEKLCVIGAGNVAVDVARTAIRHGVSEVTILYRGDMDSISADKREIEIAEIDGIKFALQKMPVELADAGVLYINTEKLTDEKGSAKFVPQENATPELFAADSIIVSVSQGPRNNIVSTTKGIEINQNGLVVTDFLGRTTREGVFASGDVVTGAKTVVEAVQVSKKVADMIDEYVAAKIG